MRPMKYEYRCANCGNPLHRPEDACRKCGYQRDSTGSSERLYHIRLNGIGQNSTKVASVLVKETGCSLLEFASLESRLPIIVYSTPDERAAKQLVEHLVEAGAEVDYYPGEVDAMESIGTEHWDEPEAEERNDKTKLNKLLFAIIILPILFRMIPEDLGDITEFLQNKIRMLTTETETFSDVSVIASARKIPAGQVIVLDDLQIVTISRSEAPEYSLAPLNVDSLLGLKAKTDISPDQIITQDLCE